MAQNEIKCTTSVGCQTAIIKTAVLVTIRFL